jgi:hypothetical protein
VRWVTMVASTVRTGDSTLMQATTTEAIRRMKTPWTKRYRMGSATGDVTANADAAVVAVKLPRIQPLRPASLFPETRRVPSDDPSRA